MLELDGVTLACVDTVNHALALRALALSRRNVRYARTLLLTDAVPTGVAVPDGVEIRPIARIGSRDEYSRFVLKSLLPHIETAHVLLIQWDGYVVNPDAFDPSFLECDYIGAKWYWFDDGMRVGNGGFSLRSRRLLEALQNPRIELQEAEDITIGRAHRPLLEREYGIRYASEALADRFAFEAAYPAGMPFGFHGLYNFCRVVPQEELAALAAGFSDAIARSLQLAQLVRNCVALGQWSAAAALARRRLSATPDDAEAATLLARAEAAAQSAPLAGRNDPCPCGSGKRYKHCHGALVAAATASATRPTAGTAPRVSAATLAQQGLAAHQRNDLDAAERAYRAALQAEPEQPLALHFLGVVQFQRDRPDEALPMLERAAELVPREPEFHNNLGLALAALDRNDDAIAAYRRALALKPEHATASNNLGLALQASNRVSEAIASYRHAIGVAPQSAQGHWNLALALLADGQFDEGWREYEWRLRIAELGGQEAVPPLPRWTGPAAGATTILVTTEQGSGDALQFVRYAQHLAERGLRVVVRAPASLCPVLATAPGVHATVATGTTLPACDAYVPMLSLPHVLDVRSVDEGPRRYLDSDPALRAQALQRTEARRRRRIGIAWAGAPNHRNDRRRSLSPAFLGPLFELPDIDWFSLQKGPREAELAQLPAARGVARLDPASEWSGTAALIDTLDAVVTVDTSIAHLAGALGKRTLVMLPFAPDWRWGASGTRTPWYPTAELYRQPRIGDWQPVVSAVFSAIQGADR